MKTLIHFFLIGFSLISLSFLHATEDPAPLPRHGIALYGEPKYKDDFTIFDYVNPKAPKGGELVLAVMGSFDSFNPFIVKGAAAAGLSPLYSSPLHATLMEHSKEEPFSQYGYIAESVEIPEDRSYVTYVLREKITFHDGTPITVDDVIYSFKTLVEKGHPLYRAYYHDVKGVQKVDERRVKFTFVDGSSRELPLIVGQLPIISKRYYEARGFDRADLKPPLGSGPYKIVDFTPGRSVTYERVPGWWGENLPISKGRYNFNRIRYEYFRDDTVSLEAFKSGGYDLRQERTIKIWKQGYKFPAATDGRIVLEKIKDNNPAGMQAFLYNTRREIFKDPLVREALSYAFDFEWTNQKMFFNEYTRIKSYFENSGLAARGLPSPEELEILESYRGRIPDNVFTKPYEPPKTDGTGNIRENLSIAKALLNKAGWRVENNILVHEKTGKPLEFEILLVRSDFERILLGFVKNLERLGVRASIRTVDSAQYTRRLENFDYDMIAGAILQSLSPGNEQREYWGSKAADAPGSRNYMGIKDPVIDEFIEKLIDAPDRKTLVHLTRALDRILLWGYYVIPSWYSNVNRFAYWKKIKRPEKLPDYDIDLHAWWTRELEKD